MGDNLNNPNLPNPLDDAVNSIAVQPPVAPHVPVLNFVRPNQQNASKATGNFELKEGTMRLMQNTCQYEGKSHEDPHKHLQEFIKLSDNLHYQNVSDKYD